jgi:hypothetical protein
MSNHENERPTPTKPLHGPRRPVVTPLLGAIGVIVFILLIFAVVTWVTWST